MFNVLLFSDFSVTYVFSLYMFNILVYLSVLTTLFCIFFLFDLKFFRTLNELKGLGNLSFVTTSVLVILLSMAGIPPFFGFVGKFLIFLFFFLKKQFFFLIFLIFFNFFALYFYVQNLRFLIRKNNFQLPFILNKNYAYLNFNLITLIIILNFLNVFGLFFTEDFLIQLNYWSSFLFIE